MAKSLEHLQFSSFSIPGKLVNYKAHFPGCVVTLYINTFEATHFLCCLSVVEGTGAPSHCPSDIFFSLTAVCWGLGNNSAHIAALTGANSTPTLLSHLKSTKPRCLNHGTSIPPSLLQLQMKRNTPRKRESEPVCSWDKVLRKLKRHLSSTVLL